MTTVKELRELLEQMLEQIEDMPDEARIRERCNTYRMEAPILETKTGFINCLNIFLEGEE